MGRTTRLRAAFSNDPTLGPMRVSSSRLARDTGPTPSLGRIRSGRVARARLAAYFAATGPCATCRRPSSRTAGFGARLCSLFHDRRFASLAVTEKTPVGFFFHRLVICLNSAGSPARPQVSLRGRPDHTLSLDLGARRPAVAGNAHAAAEHLARFDRSIVREQLSNMEARCCFLAGQRAFFDLPSLSP